jgi:predicted pyridoxine 5'-phosphate oxidase superfamily flavin-nucleotide-binding protein
MGKVYPELDERLRKFIARQPVFFVATAPSLAGGQDGHVNVSPKGYRDTFAVLGPRTVAYLDLTGSGAETIAHLRQNGKITIMFCSFDSAPKVLRLYGTGRILLPGEPEFGELCTHFPAAGFPAAGFAGNVVAQRAVIVVDIDRIADSCGYAVPLMELTEERDLLERWTANKTAADMDAYRAEKNAVSIDGLPALGNSSLSPGQLPRSATRARLGA